MNMGKTQASFGDIMALIAEKKKKEENDWKETIRNKIECDLNSQVQQALDTPPMLRRRVERREHRDQRRMRNVQIMKLNTLHHSRPPMFARLSDETSSERSFKYIDVNYAEKVAALTKNHKFDPYTSRSLPGFDFARQNGLFRYGAAMPPGDGRNMRGGLDVTLLDTSPSSLNFLSLPKHDAATGLKPMGGNVGVITFNGISLPNYGAKRKCFQVYSKDGLANLLNSRNRKNKLSHIGQGSYVDKRGVVLSKHGPFWPPGYGPVCKCPTFIEDCRKREEFGPGSHIPVKVEPSIMLTTRNAVDTKWRQAHSNQNNLQRSDGSEIKPNNIHTRRHTQSIGEFYSSEESPRRNYYHPEKARLQNNKDTKIQWKGKPVIYDCERSSRAPLSHAVPDGMPESLIFESRFESGNLRQVRRIGEYEYELVLRTDMYTKRHTQWYYFRVQNMQQNIKYKFTIINLLKKDSLYNYGMKPLVYSECLASEEKLGWHRRGENIKYVPWSNPTRNGLLSLDLQYYSLEFEITFDWENLEDDRVYLAHCYPYTYTDLKCHLDMIMANPDSSKHVKREVLCETTAGNACFLLTITEFPDKEKDKYKDFHQEKKGVVLTARVHPGESQASWMMKGVIDFLTSDCYKARQLRQNFVFKIVPMLNPDGVIVGNYRTSLAARDLNRNYRHPRQTTFPTVWHTKQMVDSFSKDHEIILYCDLHGHSRKPMVFMYGCERKALYTGSGKHSGNVIDTRSQRDCAKDFLEERLFPWLMHKRSPDRFSFHGSKYAIRRCKESTGRVVMFRQFGIMNSFTMEASFSGTMRKKLDSGRHFNIEDFLSVGRSLCEAIFDFQRLSENPILKSRVIMELTKDLAQHMIETNPQAIQSPPKDNNSSEKMSTWNDHQKIPKESQEHVNDHQKMKSGIVLRDSDEDMNIAKTAKEIIQRKGKTHNKVGGSVALLKSTQETETSIPGPPQEHTQSQTKKEMDEQDSDESDSPNDMGIDENCFRLLEQMNFQSISRESDTSSDSDSESEPEVPEESPSANRQKKKKKRKKRPGYMKSVSAQSSVGKKQESKDTQKPKIYPGFVNKYTNRSNGGIPIYAQERMQERAARRLAEMKVAEEEKIRRQNEVLLGKLDENGIKDEDARAKYAEVYGIRYQFGPHPNKPQYTLFNPFQDMTPPNGLSEVSNQTPFRVKSEGKANSATENRNVVEHSDSSSHDETSRDDSATTDRDEKSSAKPPKTVVPLQTLSFRFAGDIKDHRTLKFLNHDCMNDNDRIMTSLKEWDWSSAVYERSRTIDLGANFLRKDEKLSKIDIGADFNVNIDRPIRILKNSVPESSRNSSASPSPTSGENFSPKNLSQYEVIIGQTRYPIQIHSQKSDLSAPPVVTGESILNQKPVDENFLKSQKRDRAKSADFAKNSSTDSDEIVDQKRYLLQTQSSEEDEHDIMTSKSRLFNKRELSDKSNGLVYAVHKVSPQKSYPGRFTPFGKSKPNAGTTMYSQITKPLTAGSPTNQRPINGTDATFSVNSARL